MTKQQLRDAIELLQTLVPSAEIIYENKTYDGETQTFNIGIKSPDLPSGIGFSVCDGKVYVHGDEYAQEKAFRRIKGLVEKGDIFIASKIKQNAKTNRQQVKTELTEEDQIRVEVFA